jgi:outer membrane protein
MSKVRGRLTVLSGLLLVWALLGLAPASRGLAQESFDERGAIAQTLKSNPGLQATLVDYQRAQARLRGERARYGFSLILDGNASTGKTPELTIADPVLPKQQQLGAGTQLTRTLPYGTTLSLRFDFARRLRSVPFFTPSPTGMPMARLIEVGPGYYYDGTLSFTQALLRGSGTRVGQLELRAARLDVERWNTARERAASELLQNVVQAYWELWYAQAAFRIEGAGLELAQQQRRSAALRAEAGAIARVDVLRFGTRAASLEEQRSQGEQLVLRRTLELARLTGVELKSSAPLQIADDEPPALAGPRGDDLQRALSLSPALQEARAQRAVSSERNEVAGEALRSRLDASGQVGVHGLGDHSLSDGAQQLSSFKAVTALITVSYEMALNGTRRRMERKQAQLEVAAQDLRIEELEREIASEVLRLGEEDRGLLEQLALARQTAAIGVELARAAQERYEQGALTALDVVLAQQDAQESELRVARLQVDLVRSRVRRMHLTGTLTEHYAQQAF